MTIREALRQSGRRYGMKRWCLTFAVGPAILFCACAPHAAASESGPDRANVAYGSDSQQIFDLWLPKPSGVPAPVLILFHGGAFKIGDKGTAPAIIPRMLSGRIAVANADYRFAPRAIYPAQMLDGARVVQYLRAHHAELGVDPNRIAVMGGSAGADIALWVAFHADLHKPESADPVEHESTKVTAAVVENAQATLAATTIEQAFHTRNLPQILATFFGAGSVQDLWDRRYLPLELDASAVTHMHAGEPPVLAFYTTDDANLPPDSLPAQYLHNPAQGRYLAEVARQKGSLFTMHTVSDYANGRAGFLDEAVRFLNSEFHR